MNGELEASYVIGRRERTSRCLKCGAWICLLHTASGRVVLVDLNKVAVDQATGDLVAPGHFRDSDGSCKGRE